MTYSRISSSLALAAALSFVVVSPAHAQRHGGGGGGGAARGGAVVRGGGGVVRGGVAVGRPIGVPPRVISPTIVGYGAYRPYYYFRPGISIGFYGGFGYPYYYPYGYGYPYPYYYSYPYASPYYGYGYPSYGYPGYSYPAYSYPPSYGDPPAGTQPSYPQQSYPQPSYPQPSYPQQSYPQQPYLQQPSQNQGSVTTQPPAAYGGVRLEGAPREAQVYVDGYYAGLVEDFDGDNKHLNLTPGAHRIEIRISSQQPVAFDVNVPANQTITVRVP